MTDPTDIRQRLIRQGYHPIPNKDRATYLKDWNAADYFAQPALFDARRYATPEEAAASWARRHSQFQATGARLDNGLRAIDADIVHEALADIACAIIRDISPQIADAAPMRYGASDVKFALFVRAPDGDEAFGRVASHRYRRAEDDDTAKTSMIEIFGGAPTRDGKCARQMGVYGPHSHTEAGEVAARYSWAEPELASVPLAQLPTMSKAQALAIIDRFDAAALAAGWTRIEVFRLDDAGGGKPRLYDIDEETTRFDLEGGEVAGYAELEEGMRCSSSFFDGLPHDTKNKCHVGYSPLHDCLVVYDYETEATHYPKQFAPPDPNAFAEQMAAILPPAPVEEVPPRPDDKASMGEKVSWLLQTRGYCEQTDRVIELHEAGDDCQTTRMAFQFAHRSWHIETAGPRGGKKLAYATSGWELSTGRLLLKGVRLRPDRPFPVYEESGRRYKNTYQRPRHVGTGDMGVWHRFMGHLLPDPRERGWFMDWLAHKHRHPGVPGVAVIMVAADQNGPIYGAGRGMLRDVLARLFGAKYVRTIDFDIFSGKSAQAVYTDWMAYSLLVTVSEAKDTAESGRWSERRAVYERIKEIVDPRPVERMFTPKGTPAFTGLAFVSYLIFSNNFDAVQLPPDDRRATVLRNGVPMAPAMAVELEAWMERPGNIAELSGWLDARDLSAFNAYAPLETETKTRMQELARSDVDEAFDRVRHALGPQALFTGEMIRNAVIGELDYVTESVDAQIKRKVKNATRKVSDYRLPRSSGRHWILCWHGGPQLVALSLEEAITRATHAIKLLETLQDGTGLGAQIIDLRRS